jgi:hypothetical protein
MKNEGQRIGTVSPVSNFAPTPPMTRTVIAGSPVVRVSAPWLTENPWVWKCPDCDDGWVAATEKHLAVSAAISHRDLTHPSK